MTKPRKMSGSAPGAAALAERQEVKPPPLYQVVMLNDDFTPMDFVVQVIQQYFGRDLEAATRIMLAIHQKGRGVCGTYPKDVASTKVEQVKSAARQAGHPLQCVLESV